MRSGMPSADAPAPAGAAPLATGARLRGWQTAVLALLALAYLIVMVATGALPRQRQLVEFEARGLMRESPQAVVRVEVTRNGQRSVFVRDGGGWIREGAGEIPAEAARQLSLAVQFLNTSAPLRHLSQAELVGMTPAAFGLDRPVVSASLHGAQGQLIAVRFGSDNPEGTAQYLSADGHDGIYLISRFVGSQWNAVADLASPP